MSFSRTGAGLCIYHLFVWSNFNFLHISQWITLPTQSGPAFIIIIIILQNADNKLIFSINNFVLYYLFIDGVDDIDCLWLFFYC